MFPSCAKTPPPWSNEDAIISPRERRIYAVEISPLHPSKVLAQIKCETKAKAKIIKVIKLILKKKLKMVVAYPENIERKEEKEEEKKERKEEKEGKSKEKKEKIEEMKEEKVATDDEKEDKLEEFINMAVDSISHYIVSSANTEDIFFDEENAVVYCMVYIPADEKLKEKLIQSIKEIAKKERFSSIAEKSLMYIKGTKNIFFF